LYLRETLNRRDAPLADGERGGPDGRPPVERGERWTVCAVGHAHWGAHGAAGVLLRYAPTGGLPMCLLAQRSQSVDEPGCWGVPGGACRDDESPEVTARRELHEELVSAPEYRIAMIDVQDRGGWPFWMIVADVERRVAVSCGPQTEMAGWFTREQMLDLRLHRGLRRWMERHAL